MNITGTYLIFKQSDFGIISFQAQLAWMLLHMDHLSWSRRNRGFK